MIHLSIIAAVYIIGLMAIAHTLDHHPLVGFLWAFAGASALLLIYVAAIILTA